MSPSNSTKLCIVGAGALGTFLAEKFAAHRETYLVAKDPALRNRPTTAIKLLGDQDLPALPSNAIFIICVKAYDLDQCLSKLGPHITNDSVLVLCQNGFGIYLQAAQVLLKKRPHFARLCPSFGVRKTGDSGISLSGALDATLSVPDHDRDLLNILTPLFAQIGIKLSFPKNISQAEWEKAFLNLVINPLASVLDDKNSAVLGNQSLRELTLKIAAEVRAVARKDGFSLDHIDDNEIIARIQNCGENINSTLVDLRLGSKSELRFILGRFLRIAEGLGVQTDHLRLLSVILAQLEKSAEARTSKIAHDKTNTRA